MTKTTKKQGISREQLRKIWAAINIDDWLDLIRANRKNNQFVRSGENRLTGLCLNPQHKEQNASFNIFVKRQYFKCYGCGYYSNNPIELASLIFGTSIPEAATRLYEKYQLKFLSKKGIAEIAAQQRHQAMKQLLQTIFHELLCQAIDTPEAHYGFAKTALDWLLKERQIPPHVVHLLPVGITAPIQVISDHILARDAIAKAAHQDRKLLPSSYQESAVKYLRNYLYDPEFSGAIVWPLHVTPTEISRFKIRAPSNDKKIVIPDDEFEESLGLYGVGWEPYNRLLADQQIATLTEQIKPSAALTEGEMDVMSYMAKLMDTNKEPKIPLYSVGGVGGSRCIEPVLKALNITTAYLIGDAPEKGVSGGDPVVLSWLEQMQDIQAKVFTGWDVLAPGDDLDSAVHKCGEPAVTKAIWENRKQNYTEMHEWLANKTLATLEKIDADDSRQLTEEATLYGKYLRHRHDIQAFVDHIAQEFPAINALVLRREITSQNNNEAGFIESCTHSLHEQLFGIATRYQATGRSILAQHRTSKQLHYIRLDSEQAIVQELAPVTGKLVNFVDEHIGFPAFIPNPLLTDDKCYKNSSNSLRYYMKEAVQDLARGLPDFDTSSRYRQGYHTVVTGNDSHEYIVCGTDVFRIDRDIDAVAYTQLDGPSDNGTIFDIGFTDKSNVQPWFAGGLNTQLLDAGSAIDVKALYHELVHLFDIGFKFKHHTITTKLLAALLLVFPVISALPRQILMFFTGDTESGKSTLLSVFGGPHAPYLKLLHSSQGYEVYTPASVRRTSDRDTRLLILDEFEFTDPRRQLQVQEIMNWARGLIGNESKSIKAAVDGGCDVSIHKLPILFAAITGAEKPQDLNRLLIIEMDKVEGKSDPGRVLLEEYKTEGLTKLATQVGTAMYPHVPELKKCYTEVEQAYPQLQSQISFPVSNRYASSIFAALAFMKFIGEDWQAFFREHVSQHSHRIQQASTITESEDYLDTMLRTTAIMQHETHTVKSVAEMLANPHDRESINTSSTGVFLDEDQGLLLILLGQAAPRLIPPNHKARGLTTTQLKATLERHKLALTPDEISKTGILRRVIPYLGANIQEKHVVVFRITDADWLVSWDTIQEAQKGTSTDKPETQEPKQNIGNFNMEF